MKNAIFLMLLIAAQTAWAAQSPQTALAGAAIPQFAQPLPSLALPPQNGTMSTVLGNTSLTLRMCEFKSKVLPPGAVPNYSGTWVWGYLVDPTGTSTCADLLARYGGVTGTIDTYIGPVIVNQRGTPTSINFVNDLGSAGATNVLAYKYSIERTLHWANPDNVDCGHGMAPMFGMPCAENYAGPIPVVPHLHGGEVPPELDGGPDSWYTSDGLVKGPRYYSFAGAAANAAIYNYPNTQEAAPIWFHDHTLGATRLNVYAGLAGAYFIYDPGLAVPSNLTPLNEVVPIVIQDRQFDTAGQLFFQAGTNGNMLWALNPEHPYWSPEFVGDAIVVNGKAWPYLNVEPKRYRFLFLNGSNARTYELFLTNRVTKVNGPSMYVIGSDGGYLDAPVLIDPNAAKPALTKLVIMPGERYEVIIDFAGQPPGTSLFLKNVAKTPFPNGVTPDGATIGQLMEFRVGTCSTVCGPADQSYDPVSGGPLRRNQPIVRLANAATGTANVIPDLTRQLTLNEVMGMPTTAVNPITGAVTAYPGGPLEVLINNTKWSGQSSRPYGDFQAITAGGTVTYFSETPQEGSTEFWEIVNLTADAHPIHLHLVQFQVVNRQVFDFKKYNQVYGASFPGGAYVPGFGPPLHYNGTVNPLGGGKFGGNPDVAPYLKGPARPPAANEVGWKDTVIAYPGEVTRIAVRWAPTDAPARTRAADLYYPFDPNGSYGQFSYVWHCHIIDHEDNEMMRPDLVLPNGNAIRSIIKGVDY
jgi:spore coat protein A, manganese oxidase